MAISDNTAVTKRIDVNRRLTYGEMDTNFEQLSLVITDVGTLEGQIGDKVDTSVYANKISDIDENIQELQDVMTSLPRPNIIAGFGSPEGVVTAPIGSLFLNGSGGVGSTLYIKEAGTGNTGWGAK
jgi:hypothetical protein